MILQGRFMDAYHRYQRHDVVSPSRAMYLLYSYMEQKGHRVVVIVAQVW